MAAANEGYAPLEGLFAAMRKRPESADFVATVLRDISEQNRPPPAVHPAVRADVFTRPLRFPLCAAFTFAGNSFIAQLILHASTADADSTHLVFRGTRTPSRPRRSASRQSQRIPHAHVPVETLVLVLGRAPTLRWNQALLSWTE